MMSLIKLIESIRLECEEFVGKFKRESKFIICLINCVCDE